MIAKLRGLLDSLAEDAAIIDVGGVGYLIFASSRTLSALGTPGETVEVVVETHVREDHIHLYGFATHAERDNFRLLTSVQGVGAKVALAILSVLDASTLTNAIAAQDKTTICQANGVGPKLAARIINELKDKVGSLAAVPVAGAVPTSRGAPAPGLPSSAVADAVSALTNLGYRPVEAHGAVSRVVSELGEAASVQDLITRGLKELSQ